MRPSKALAGPAGRTGCSVLIDELKYSILVSLPRQQVGDDLVDLVLGQGQVRHAAGLAVGGSQLGCFGVHRLLLGRVADPLAQVDVVQALPGDALQVELPELLRLGVPDAIAARLVEEV